jgi:hypothetical protein
MVLRGARDETNVLAPVRSPMPHDVFISYSPKDKPVADAACAVLEAHKLRCWIAPRDLMPGSDKGEATASAIDQSRVFVLIFSSAANASADVRREVERAVNRGIAVIPVRIEDVTPAKSLEYFISTPHWLDAFTPPLERHLLYLTHVVRHLLHGAELPDRPAARPNHAPGAQPVRVDRRLLIGAGGAVLALGLGGWLIWGRSPPSFVGKWMAEVQLTPEALSPLPFTYATDVFVSAALHAGPAMGTFEVTPAGRYSYITSVEDQGGVSLEGDRLTFTSDATRQSSSMAFYVVPPEQIAGLAIGLGGDAGDSGLVLNPSAPLIQITLPGKPEAAAQGPLAAVAGRWSSSSPSYGTGATITLALEIVPEGRYSFHAGSHESGLWQAENGKWTRTPQNRAPLRGTYEFEGSDRVRCVDGTGVTVWTRAE